MSKMDRLIELLEQNLKNQKEHACGCGQSVCDSQIVHSSSAARFNEQASFNAAEAQRQMLITMYGRAPTS